MKIVNSYPPNIDKIDKKFNVKDKPAVFTYGDTLFNPKGGEISKHLEVHEETHSRQQNSVGIEEWWNKYIEDSEFRLEQELEAYGNQYKFINDSNLRRKVKDAFLEKISSDLSSELYGNILSLPEAKSKIRNKVKSFFVG